ncbi:hypothetical protein KAR91_18995 [Candidatus Pacearchaeota archaeon]|nr:hypothetical protein [Candidatus Pacearchaeota archaeon]
MKTRFQEMQDEAAAEEVALKLKGEYVVWCRHCLKDIAPIDTQDDDKWHRCPDCKVIFRKNLL